LKKKKKVAEEWKQGERSKDFRTDGGRKIEGKKGKSFSSAPDTREGGGGGGPGRLEKKGALPYCRGKRQKNLRFSENEQRGLVGTAYLQGKKEGGSVPRLFHEGKKRESAYFFRGKGWNASRVGYNQKREDRTRLGEKRKRAAVMTRGKKTAITPCTREKRVADIIGKMKKLPNWGKKVRPFRARGKNDFSVTGSGRSGGVQETGMTNEGEKKRGETACSR